MRRSWGAVLNLTLQLTGIIGLFWILKTLKKGIFISYYQVHSFSVFGNILTAPQAEMMAKVFNVAVSVLLALVLTALSRRCSRAQFYFVMNLFMASCLGLLRLNFSPDSEFMIWVLYIGGDIFIMALLPCFMAMASNQCDIGRSTSKLSCLGLGGIVGGVIGSVAAQRWLHELSIETWLDISIVLTLIFATVTTVLKPHDPLRAQRLQKPPLLSGAYKVFNSSYLSAIMVFVILYEIISSLIDFQFTSASSARLQGAELQSYFAKVYLVANLVAAVVQIFLAASFLRRTRLQYSLFIFPALIGVSALFLAAAPGLILASLMPVLDNGLNFSLNQSTREVLFSLTPSQFSVRAFIDIFVSRMAKLAGLFMAIFISATATQDDLLRQSGIWIFFLALLLLGISVFLGKSFNRSIRMRDGA